MESGAPVQLEHVTMAFGDRPVFDDLSCAFPRGPHLGGPGRQRLGQEHAAAAGRRASSSPAPGASWSTGRTSPGSPERELFRVRRKLGMLFQHGALLDSMTVFDNLALPLREHERLDEPRDRRRGPRRASTAVGLRDVDGLLPSQLSGGMVKRVALARAIIRSPAVLLCDEPFSGLDPLSSRRIESLLVRHQRHARHHHRGRLARHRVHDAHGRARAAPAARRLRPGRAGRAARRAPTRACARSSGPTTAALALPEAS